MPTFTVKITQRNSTIGILGLQAIISLLMAGTLIVSDASVQTKLGTVAGGLVLIGLLVAYLRGIEYARHATVIIITLLTGFLMPEPYVSQQAAFSILIAPTLALILTSPLWVLGSAIVVLGSLFVRAQMAGVSSIYMEPGNLLGIVAVVVGMILARLVADTAQQTANQNAISADQERTKAEERAVELDTASKRLEAELSQQRSLLALVDSLETPVVHLANGVLFAPVVGHLDPRRADALMRRLLEMVHVQRARTLIIDIAGVAIIDTAVADALVRTVQGLGMLGCEVVVSGISAPVASTLVQLGASLGNIRTVRSPKEALTV
jgi:rsbT co-antagonist protein RsbR